MVARYTRASNCPLQLPYEEMIKHAELYCKSINSGALLIDTPATVLAALRIKHAALEGKYPCFSIPIEYSVKVSDLDADLTIFIGGENKTECAAFIELYKFQYDRWSFIIASNITHVEAAKLQGHKQVKVPCDKCQHLKLTPIEQAADVFTKGCNACISKSKK